jgi:hypothetical protein
LLARNISDMRQRASPQKVKWLRSVGYKVDPADVQGEGDDALKSELTAPGSRSTRRHIMRAGQALAPQVRHSNFKRQFYTHAKYISDILSAERE